jgi:hypothetical protein
LYRIQCAHVQESFNLEVFHGEEVVAVG